MKITKQRKAIHEASHVILASIFFETFEIESVTIDENKAILMDELASGGLHIKPIKTLDKFEYDQLILIFLASIAGDQISNNNSGIPFAQFIDDNIIRIMDNPHYQGDFQLVNSCFNEISGHLIGIHYLDYLKEALIYLTIFFLSTSVWSAHTKVASALKESESLSKFELKEILLDTELEKWIKENQELINSRSQIFK